MKKGLKKPAEPSSGPIKKPAPLLIHHRKPLQHRMKFSARRFPQDRPILPASSFSNNNTRRAAKKGGGTNNLELLLDLFHILAFSDVHFASTLVPTDLILAIAATTINPTISAYSSTSPPLSSRSSRPNIEKKRDFIGASSWCLF